MINRAQKTIFNLWIQLKNWYGNVTGNKRTSRVTSAFQKHPLAVFFGLLGLILILIILGSLIESAQKENPQREQIVKEVQTYSIGTSPKISLQAKLEKAGVVQVVAQSGGIVQNIFLNAGDQVTAGQAIIKLSTNAQGQDASALQASLAGTQYRLASTTLEIQQDIIAKQREVAIQTRENTEELREISEASLQDTREVLNENRDIINSINDSLETLENTNQGGTNDTLIQQTRQLKSQYSSGIAQLQAQVRNTEYQTNTENPPTELADLQKDITLRQLDLQEKSLKLQKEIAGIQSSLAQITASLMRPASPFKGTVERVYVKQGQNINPGTIIATVSSDEQSVEAIVNVPAELANNISRLEPSVMYLHNTPLTIFPKYISQNATDGQLYSVIYCLPEGYESSVTDQSYIPIDMPIGVQDTGGTVPFIPIDAVFQSQDKSYVYIVKNNKAAVRTVGLGSVYGRYVEVRSGIQAGDTVILNRNVVDGDAVTLVRNN